MLIIAQPKSCSTSLLETIHRYSRLSHLRNRITGARFPTLPIFEALPHMCMKNLSYEQYQKAEKGDTLYRLHIPPTSHNLSYFTQGEHKIILTTRSPQDSIRAYSRHKLENNKPAHKNMTPEELAKASLAMDLWHKGWTEILPHPNFLHLTFEEIVLNQSETLRKVEHFWDIEIKTDTLVRRRYSGIGERLERGKLARMSK